MDKIIEVKKINECYFTIDKTKTSATICANCGNEKYLHTIGESVKISIVIISNLRTN